MEAEWRSWIGRTESSIDHAAPGPLRAISVTLDATPYVETGDRIPTLAHWLYFRPLTLQSHLDAGGGATRGGFMPPIPMLRRMWSGGSLVFHDALRVGDVLERKSEIVKIAAKPCRSGRMSTVTVKHLINGPRGLALSEEQDIVFTDVPKVMVPPMPISLPDQIIWHQPYPLDPVLLFRFSALTFNAHRVHYDLRYTTQVEKYPGLVVHAPLQAMLLLRAALARNPSCDASRYNFRVVRPLFDFDNLYLSAQAREDGGLDLYTSNGEGYVCMHATVYWQE